MSRLVPVALVFLMMMMMMTVAVPRATAQPRMPDPVLVAGELDAVSDALKIEKLLHMDLKRLLALTLGVAVGIAAADIWLAGEFRIIGMAGGALLGEFWYRKRYFPFN